MLFLLTTSTLSTAETDSKMELKVNNVSADRCASIVSTMLDKNHVINVEWENIGGKKGSIIEVSGEEEVYVACSSFSQNVIIKR